MTLYRSWTNHGKPPSARPVAAADRCPLLPSSHWACCACEAPEVAGTDAA
jgi:hypothetical protein